MASPPCGPDVKRGTDISVSPGKFAQCLKSSRKDRHASLLYSQDRCLMRGPQSEFTTRDATHNDVRLVARLHREAFPRHNLTALGNRFLRSYYRLIVQQPDGILLLCIEPKDGQAIGFCAGVADATRFYSLLSTRKWRLALSVSPFALLRPRMLTSLLAARQWVTDQSHQSASHCELVSIGVHPDFRGVGSGRFLVEAFIAAAKSVGASCIILTTDASGNDGVRNLYEAVGFSADGVFMRGPGRAMVKYRYVLRSELDH